MQGCLENIVQAACDVYTRQYFNFGRGLDLLSGIRKRVVPKGAWANFPRYFLKLRFCQRLGYSETISKIFLSVSKSISHISLSISSFVCLSSHLSFNLLAALFFSKYFSHPFPFFQYFSFSLRYKISSAFIFSINFFIFLRVTRRICFR